MWRGRTLLSIIYPFSTQESAPSWVFLSPVPQGRVSVGEESRGWRLCPHGSWSPVTRERGALLTSSCSCLKLMFNFHLGLTRISWQCKSLLKDPWHPPHVPALYFTVILMHSILLPILSKFLLQKCIIFQPRSNLSLEISWFISHYVSRKSSSATLGMKISWIYREVILLLLYMLDFSWL